MITHRILALGVVAGLLGLGAPAHAASGAVKGVLQLWEANGGHCPLNTAGRNCTGSNFTSAHTNSYQPIANGKVYLYMTVGTAQVLIGSGTTSSSGNFTISWSTTSTLGQTRVVFRGEQMDSRFATYDASGLKYRWEGAPFTLTSGTTPTAPQLLPQAVRFGSSTAADPALNFWAAAETTWWYGMMAGNKLYNDFTDIKLKGVYANISPPDPNDCGTCGSGFYKYVRLNAAFDFEVTTVAHELGHVASYILNPRRTTGDYCYGTGQLCAPDDSFCCVGGGIGSHQQDSAEWQQVGFEEGLASAMATIALNQKFAPDPYFCTQSGSSPCSTGTAKWRMEPSKATVGSCPLAESRQENSAARYLWDLYDTIDDPEYVDNVGVNYWELYDVITRFPDGYALRQDNDPYVEVPDGPDPGTSPDLAFDNRDGFNGQAFQQRSVGATGFPSGSADVMRIYDHNCGIDYFGFDP